MNKLADYKLLLQRAYDEGITKEGLTVDTIDEIKTLLEEDKPEIDSVFGVAFGEDSMQRETLYVYVSDSHTWLVDGHCSDCATDDTWNVLRDMGFSEEMESVFTPSTKMIKKFGVPNREELIEKLKALIASDEIQERIDQELAAAAV